MESALRSIVLDWLRTDPVLAATLNIVAEESPKEAHAPWAGIVASASADWSTKTQTGREIRFAIELHLRGDDAATGAQLMGAVEQRLQALPADQPDFRIVSMRFLRARTEARPRNARATLLEYRFRCLAD